MDARTALGLAPGSAAWPPAAAEERTAPGDWEPLWIGPTERALYAALHRVPGAPATGIVLVPPMFDELPRSRRLVTEVAGELAATGLPVLRFDFFGTGDSAGRGDDADFDTMCGDLDRAITTLRARTGVPRLVLLAWRGAALVVDAWLSRGGRADLVVLWDPIRDGSGWLRGLGDADVAARAMLPPPRPGVPRTVEAEDGQLMGFRVSPRLRRDVEAARLDAGQETSGAAERWAVLYPDDAVAGVDRVFVLPPNAPRLGTGATMDGTLFLTPQLRGFVRALGPALARGGAA